MRRLLATTTSLVLLGTLTACGEAPPTASSPRSGSSPDALAWQRIADPPTPPRVRAVVAWTGTEVLQVGGDTSTPCPANADCAEPPEYARDGAAYDPVKGTWRRLAPAPEGISATGYGVVGDRLFVLNDETLLAYDVPGDSWSRVPTPPGFAGAQVVVDGSRLLFVSGSDETGEHPDRVYVPRTGRWSVLPEDPIGPAFDRVATVTPEGVVLTARELVPNPGGSDGPSLVLAARLERSTGTWTRLPDSDQLGGWRWAWTGRHLVDPTLGGADGGEVGNYGRTIPYGGVLDPATGRWSRLPGAPAELSGGWTVEALGGSRLAAGGWIFDDADETWTRVPRPEGAPAHPGDAVWADGRLVVIGGVDHPDESEPGVLSPNAWTSSPAGPGTS